MNSLASALGSLVGQTPSSKLEYDHGSLQIRANTLVIGNSIYPIANISTVAFSDLRNPVPTFVWILIGIGVLFTVTGVGALVGIPLVAFGCYLLYLNHKAKAAADYALNVQMNSGDTAALLSDNGDFLKSIALELYEVIELEEPSNTTFNLDQSIKIDNITGSAVAVGSVRGDIVNNVLGA